MAPGVLRNPDDRQFLKPDDMPKALQDYCRKTEQPISETPGQRVRCALESLALKYRMVLGWLKELTGVRVEVVHIVGGGTRNEILNPFTANACNRPVITGPTEATDFGNVLMQARTAGEIASLTDLRRIVRVSSDVKNYEPADRDAWRTATGRFLDLLSRSL
ncbi:MAG: FGGY-family carbohydrate kinase [Fuerstiella sp.]